MSADHLARDECLKQGDSMMRTRGKRSRETGVAAVEMAMVLPFLMFTFMATVDFARAFYCSVVVTGCARNGAAYARLSKYDPASPYASLEAAALADAGDMTPKPTVTSATGVDAGGNSYADVTVSYPFKTMISWPGISNSFDVVRTVRTQKAADSPS
jgi:Flp pilus assembly protein TadG